LILGDPVDLLSKSRLQSKIATIFTVELFVSTNLEFKNKPVYVSLIHSKRVSKHLKTKRDRKPYLDEAIREVKEKYKGNKDPHLFNYIIDTSFNKQFENTFILKAIKKK